MNYFCLPILKCNMERVHFIFSMRFGAKWKNELNLMKICATAVVKWTLSPVCWFDNISHLSADIFKKKKEEEKNEN